MVSIIVTVALAFIGYFATYFNNLRIAQRKDRLDLVNRQLYDFYGPLYVSAKVGQIAFQAFLLKNNLPQNFIFGLTPPSHDSPILEKWRIWMTEVLMPLNEMKEQLILRNAYLIREAEIPECLLMFVAHSSAYKAVLKRWSDGDYSEHLSIIEFPEDLDFYASTSYQELKAEQLRLLRRKR